MVNKKKLVAIIIAREGSSRLPRKHTKMILGKPLLSLIIERIKDTELFDEVCLATSNLKVDEPLIEIAKEEGINYFAGEPEDVLDRLYNAALKSKADYIYGVGGDCPFVDKKTIENGLDIILNLNFDFVCNFSPATYPDGLDVPLITINCLKKLCEEASMRSQRIHPFPYIFDNEHLFKIKNFSSSVNLSNYRLTLDYPEDFLLIEKIFHELYPMNRKFTLDDIISLLNKKNDLLKINSKYILPQQPIAYWNTLAYIDDLYKDLVILIEESRKSDSNNDFSKVIDNYNQAKKILNELTKRAQYKKENH